MTRARTNRPGELCRYRWIIRGRLVAYRFTSHDGALRGRWYLKRVGAGR